MRRSLLSLAVVSATLIHPANALDIRVDPASLCVFDVAPEWGLYDVVLQDILVVNNEKRVHQLKGL